MAKCDVRVVLEQPGPFRAGDVVRGEVTVEVFETIAFTGLRLLREWRTHGRGNRAGSDPVGIRLATAGEWPPGAYRFPFDFRAPNGPFTYRGYVLNVDWYVRAELEVPWSFDSKNEIELLLIPGAEPQLSDKGSGRPTAYPPPGRNQELLSRIVLLGVGGSFALIGGMIALVGVTMLLNGWPDALFVALIGSGSAALGSTLFYFGIRNTIAQRRLGRPEVTVTRDAIPGDTIDVAIRLRPRADVELESVKATLTGCEAAQSGSGTRKRTHSHTLHTAERVLLESPRTLKAGEISAFEGRLQLPHDAAWTFAAAWNDVKWTVNVEISIRGWPSWSEDYLIVVRPPWTAPKPP